MTLTWNSNLDTLLSEVVESSEGDTWSSIASRLSERAEFFISGDAARKRYERLKAAEDFALRNYGTGEVKLPDPANVLPHVEQGEFVGFNNGYWDLETTSLGAWTGHLLVASVADNWGNIQHRTKLDFEQRDLLDDRGLALWIRDRLEEFDINLQWNGFMFDIPMLNARLLYHNEKPLRDQMAIDLRFKHGGGRYGLQVGSAKLKNVAAFFETPNQKPDLPPSVWKRAEIGDTEALEVMVDRCDADCLVLRDIFQRSKSMIRTIHR